MEKVKFSLTRTLELCGRENYAIKKEYIDRINNDEKILEESMKANDLLKKELDKITYSGYCFELVESIISKIPRYVYFKNGVKKDGTEFEVEVDLLSRIVRVYEV